MSDIIEKVRELSEVRAEMERLGIRKAELEKYISEQACVDIEDTKYKSVTYSDPNSQARVTYRLSDGGFHRRNRRDGNDTCSRSAA